ICPYKLTARDFQMPNLDEHLLDASSLTMTPEIIETSTDMDRPFWNMGRETMPAEQMRILQTDKLRRQLIYLANSSDFYKQKFQASGFKPADFRTIEDIQGIPFTTKAELRESQENHPPFGLHRAAPM